MSHQRGTDVRLNGGKKQARKSVSRTQKSLDEKCGKSKEKWGWHTMGGLSSKQGPNCKIGLSGDGRPGKEKEKHAG